MTPLNHRARICLVSLLGQGQVDRSTFSSWQRSVDFLLTWKLKYEIWFNIFMENYPHVVDENNFILKVLMFTRYSEAKGFNRNFLLMFLPIMVVRLAGNRWTLCDRGRVTSFIDDFFPTKKKMTTKPISIAVRWKHLRRLKTQWNYTKLCWSYDHMPLLIKSN